MELEDAIKYLAELIWAKGEIKEASGCLVPTWYSAPDITDYNKASDVIFKKMNKTHYDRKWKVKGKTVELNFYKAEAFGAATPKSKTKLTVMVDV